MRHLLSALRAPAATVVAVHDTESTVESDVRLLGSAGYDSRMLTIVGRQCPLRHCIVAGSTGRGAAWRPSGMSWGLSLGMLVTAAALVLPPAALAPTSLLLVAGLVLALRVSVIGAALAPERTGRASWRSSSTGCRGYEDELAADKLLLIVEGTRSEVALARALLQAH
jgi:hypothetical protein